MNSQIFKLLMLILPFGLSVSLHATQQAPIVVETADNAIVFNVGDNGRLYQSYIGKVLSNKADYATIPVGTAEAYVTHGMEDYFEPALHINRESGNSSTLLQFKSSSVTAVDGGSKTTITLCDPYYKDEVDLNYVAYAKENVIKTWATIRNCEKSPIELVKYASSMLHFDNRSYYLTQFNGDWANEVNASEAALSFGKKVIDSKLGTRANLFASPFFVIALDAPSQENNGDVVVGTLAWTGNFRFTFEVDQTGSLRVISGINPYYSEYTLKKGETFETPEFIFTFSHNGKGMAARNLHDWARNYQLKDGNSTRMTLLNNWEATYFDFNEEKLVSLIGEAKTLGVDMFLLDDGWFGNKYPRSSDTQGLGDWSETTYKLPSGLSRLTDEAKSQGIKFGLWIEPEMVNPKSELYETHKDWVITLPNRDEYYFRNQLVLDLSNPKVQDYVFSIVDGLKTKYPDIAYFKWDCNSPITNIYSNYEGKNQSQLYVDYVKGLYNVLDRINAKYPDLPMMLCSGGGGRTDYQGLKYFTEFWPSDNTDPVERLYIQWNYSQIFPAKAQCAHVTTWNKTASVKFKIDVAMMGKLGFDINLHDMTSDEVSFCKSAIKCYNDIKSVVYDGNQYRLVSPYDGNHTATMYVTKDCNRALLFAFDIHPRFNEHNTNVKLQGLNPNAMYSITEINRIDGNNRNLGAYSGDYLMTIGMPIFSTTDLTSTLLDLNTVNAKNSDTH